MTVARQTDCQQIKVLELDTVKRLNGFFKLLNICDNNKASQDKFF